jgi:cytoskeletal protein CcmA (bactofilin family)
MALWKEPPKQAESLNPVRYDVPEPKPEPSPHIAAVPVREKHKSESLIAPDLTIEGKIEGSGHVRIAGRFKGDVDVHGDLTIEQNANLTGSVRAEKVVIAGDLVGNIEAASHVEIAQSGALMGDLKAKTLSVAAGSRMRGNVDFGWDDAKTPESMKRHDAKPGDRNGSAHTIK